MWDIKLRAIKWTNKKNMSDGFERAGENQPAGARPASLPLALSNWGASPADLELGGPSSLSAPQAVAPLTSTGGAMVTCSELPPRAVLSNSSDWSPFQGKSRRGRGRGGEGKKNPGVFINRWSLKISLEKVMEEVTAAGLFGESQWRSFHLTSVSSPEDFFFL